MAHSHLVYQQAFRRFERSAYRAAMRLRRLRNDGEIEALVPFDSRVIQQHMPMRGKDGFLFHCDHDALDQLSAVIVLHQRQLRTWIDALEGRLAWCKANRAAMRFLAIPEKHVVYADKLPRFTRVSPRRPAMQLIDALEGDVAHRTIYPLEPLKEASRSRQTYFKTDTHWNAHGAFVAYEALIDSLREEIVLNTVSEADLRWKERRFVGDLGVRFLREQGETRLALEPSTSYRLSFQNHNFGRGAVHIYESTRRDLPTCVLFRDSFSNALIPYLMSGFSRLVAVSSLSCHYDLLEQEKPDVVLFVAIERFLATFGRGLSIELPQDAERRPFEDFTGTALSEIVPPPSARNTAFHGLDVFAPWNMPSLVFGDGATPPPASVAAATATIEIDDRSASVTLPPSEEC